MEQQDDRNNVYTLTVPEVAARLKVSRGTIYSMISRNQFPHLRLGRSLRISQKQLDAFLSGGAV